MWCDVMWSNCSAHPNGIKSPSKLQGIDQKKRPSYSSELKQDAAELILNKCYNVADACQATVVGPIVLRRWIEQLQIERGGQEL